jgi:hypothetical protein
MEGYRIINKVFGTSSKVLVDCKEKDASKLTKKEIYSLLVAYYGVSEKLDKKKNEELMTQLRQELEANQGKMFY